jgi:hypothetical protein
MECVRGEVNLRGINEEKKKKKNQVKFHNEQEVLDLEVSGDVNEEAGGTRNGHYNYTIKHTRVKGERSAVNRE